LVNTCPEFIEGVIMHSMPYGSELYLVNNI